eukprot:Hpha_TRINITY_DN5655_c0_g1::TRINITY_DN5655_c0_g1_i1::g.50648::m.50648
MAIPVPRRHPGYPSPGGGGTTGTVTFEFFADLQCPFSAKAWTTFRNVVDHYHGKIKFYFTPYVIAGHQQAFDVHRCLDVVFRKGGAGQLFEFVGFLFKNQAQFSNASFKSKTPLDLLHLLGSWVEQYGITPAELEEMIDTDETFDTVRAAQRRGIGLGVWTTPSFYINGALVTRVTGSCDVARWIEYLDTFDL